MKDYHGTRHPRRHMVLRGSRFVIAALLGSRPPAHVPPAYAPPAYAPPNQWAPPPRRLRQASSITQLGTAPLSDAR